MLEAFISNNHVKINKLPHLLAFKHNISPEERSAIKRLNDNPNLIIKPADKGSGIVLMSSWIPVIMSMRPTNSLIFMKNCPVTRLEVIQVLFIMKQREEIDQKCFSFLAAGPTKPGRFYLLPKIHKGKLPPPGRPIISAIGSPTKKISQFVDFFLQPHLQRMPSYVKDTGDFLHIISKLDNLPPDTILVTLDVTSLYTNVPLEQAKIASHS